MKHAHHLRPMTMGLAFWMLCAGAGRLDAAGWAKSYGGPKIDVADSIAVTADGDYVVAGRTSSFGAKGEDAWVFKLDSDGNVKWAKRYGGDRDDEARSVAVTPDGDYVVAGYTRSFSGGRLFAWVLKLDKDGAVKWQKTYGGAVDDVASSIAVAQDGNYVVAGFTNSFGAGMLDAWVLKLNKENGNVIWQKTYGGSWDDLAYSVAVAADGDYVVAGETRSFGWDAWVLKLDKDNGNVLWQKTYGGAGDDVARSIALASDGHYVVAGHTNSFGAGKEDAWVLKLNKDNGNVIWQHTYGGVKDDQARAITEAADGDYVVAGSTHSFGPDFVNAWVLKLNKDNGNVAWEKTYEGEGETAFEAAYSIARVEGGYVVAGVTNSSGGRNPNDAWVLKLKTNGDIDNCSLVRNSDAAVGNDAASVVNTNATVGSVDISTAATPAQPQNTRARIRQQCPEKMGFLMECNPRSLLAQQGGGDASLCTVASQEGFSDIVNLSCSGLPPGLTCTFESNPVTPPADDLAYSPLSVNVDSGVAPGSYTFYVEGQSGDLADTVEMEIVVGPSFQVTCAPGSLTVIPGGSGSATCTVTSANGFTGAVDLVCSGLPLGVTCSFDPSPLTLKPGVSAMTTLTVTADESVWPGVYPFPYAIQVDGTSGDLTQTFFMELVVEQPEPGINLSANLTRRLRTRSR